MANHQVIVRVVLVTILVVEGRRHRTAHRLTHVVGLHDDRHRSGGVGQIHVLRRLVTGVGQIAQHVIGRQSRTLERLNQAVSTMHQILDLLAGQFAATRDVGENTLAIGAGLLDHVATLLLGHQHLGLRVSGRVLATAGTFELGFLADSGGVLGGITQQALGGFLGPGPDLARGFPGRLNDAGGLFAQHVGEFVLVEIGRNEGHALGSIGDFALEIALALLETRQFGGDHAQEIADFARIESAASGRERGPGNGGRGRRIRTRH